MFIAFIQFPHRNLHRKITPRKQSSPHIAIQTPFRPKLAASKADNGIRTAHMLTKFIPLGISELNKAMHLYAAPVINDNVERIWIDRLILLRPDDERGRAMQIRQ